ncbi:MAG: CAP domain-containing protein [bacterium]
MGIFLLPNLAYLSAITPEEIIALTNKEREAAGLNTLIANQLLTQAAILKGKAILESQTFSHAIDDKKFSSWIRDAGYDYSYVGENLAIDFVASESIMEAWKNSPSHKKNLLSPYYKEIGISTIDGKFQGQNTTIVVQIFGSPAVNSTQPLSPDSGLNSANSNINFLEANPTDYRFGRAENFLTNSMLNQNLLPDYNSRLILPTVNNFNFALNPSRELSALVLNTNGQSKLFIFSNEVNKFIIQPGPYTTADNFLIIFTFLALIYFLIFLYRYYFLKINKLSSI